jgi:Trm5-related predicted tRNA methylase
VTHPHKPLPNAKAQRRTLELIYAHEAKSGTKRGLGTGRGRLKGVPDRINHRLREVIAAADTAISNGESLEEVTRRLAAVGLVEPAVFERVKQQAPRYATMQGIPPRETELIKTLNEPTLQEIADHSRIDIVILQRMKRTSPDLYERLRLNTIEAGMTPGEQAVYSALQYRQVTESYKQLAGEQQLKKLTRRVAKRRRSLD